MRFTKSNLLYKHYSWTAIAPDNPKISGEPDRTLFNRGEGYEVLYMINKVMNSHGLSAVASGQKIERMIKSGLPGDVRSQSNVINWIVYNWDNY